MHKKLLPGLIGLLMPFAAYGSSRTYAGFLHKPSVSGIGGDVPSRTSAIKIKQPTVAAHDELAITVGAPARELIIVDASVPDKAVLQAAARPGIDMVILKDGENAMEEAVALLQGYQNLDAVHLVSHAEAGRIMLGGRSMDKESLEAQPQFLAALDQATRAGADLLFYGCKLAREDTQLLELIQNNSHLDVAASNDLTGASALGGDWNLEIQVGEIETPNPFSKKSLKDFVAVLGIHGTRTFESWNGEYYGDDPSKDWGDFATYIATPGTYYEMLSGTVCGDDLYISTYGAGSDFFIRSDPAGGDFGMTSLNIVAADNGGWPADSVSIYGYAAGNPTPVASKTNVAVSTVSTVIDLTTGVTGSFADVRRLKIDADDAGDPSDKVDFCLRSVTFTPLDTDGNLAASGGVSEPVGLDTTVDTAEEAEDVFDFTISDGGSADGEPLLASQLVLHVAGTATDTERGQITWRLNGPDASNITGTYDAGTDTLTFSGLTISVADGDNETYTINAWYNDTAGLIEGHTIILGVDGDTDLTVDANGTQMGMTSAVTNGTGIVIMVPAPILALSVDDGGEYARYGQIRDYLVTVSNSGDAETSGANASSTYSAGLLAAASSWQCLNGGSPGNPAEPHCTPSSGTGAFGASIDLPIGSSLSFLVSVPVDIAATVPVVQLDVSVTDSAHAITVSDSDINTLVLFRDGFDVPFAAGTQVMPSDASSAAHSACANGAALMANKSPILAVPAQAGEALVDTLFAARIDADNHVAVERLNFATVPWLRLFLTDADGSQRASAWAASRPGTSLALGLGNDGVARWLLLEGEQRVSLRLPLSNAAAQGGHCD